MIPLRGVGSLCLYEPEAYDLSVQGNDVACPVRKLGRIVMYVKTDDIINEIVEYPEKFHEIF